MTTKTKQKQTMLAHVDSFSEVADTDIDKLNKKVGTKTMAIRVDIVTYNNLKIMAEGMPLATFLRLFSSGDLKIESLAGYNDRITLKDIHSLLVHIGYEQDKDGEYLHKVGNMVKNTYINTNSLLLEKDKTDKADQK